MLQNEVLVSDTSGIACWKYSAHKVSCHGSVTIRVFIKLNAFKAFSASTGFACMHVILYKTLTDIWYQISLLYGEYVLPSQQVPLNHAMSHTGEGLYFPTVLFSGFNLIVLGIFWGSVWIATYKHCRPVLVCITAEQKSKHCITFLLRGVPGCLPHTATPGAAFLACDMGKAGCLVALLMNIFQCCASLWPHVRQSMSAANTPHLPSTTPYAPLSLLSGREERICTLIIPLSHHMQVITGPSRCLWSLGPIYTSK